MDRKVSYAWPAVIAIGVIFIFSNAVWLVPFVRDTEASAVRYQAEIARRVALRADFFLEKKLRELGELALDLMDASAPSGASSPIVNTFLARHPDFIAVAVEPLTPSNAEYAVSPVTQVSGRKVIRITAPLPYSERSIEALVTIGSIVQEMAEERVGSLGRIYAVDGAGGVVFHEYEGVAKVGEASREFMASDAILDAGSAGRYTNEAGEDVLGVALRAPGIGWTVVAEDPLSEAWAKKYDAQALAVILVFMGIVFTVILIVSFRKIMAIASREEALHTAKSEYISLLAHQLRTPLTGTKWNIKTLLDGDWGKLNDRQRKFLTRSYETNEQMIRLVNDLLNITRIEDGKYDFSPRKTDIPALVARVADSFRESARAAGIKLSVKKPRSKARIPQVVLDADKMEVVLGNLVDNAIRYNRPNGSVEISYAREVHVVRIAVKDTGVGIPARQKHLLFSRFFRGENVVKMQVQGFGLGLFLARNIVERHKGTITVDTQENEGTAFTITLPLR